LAPVGPNGEPLLCLALQQAARAGFQKAILVVGATTSAAIREALAGEWRPHLPIEIVSQERVGPPRARPWGTVAALLAAGLTSDVVVANGDDLYGEVGLRDALAWMATRSKSAAAGIFYPVGATVTERGVSRGLPTIVDGRMTGIVEQRDVRRVHGVVRLADGTVLAEDRPVSMNLWCLRRSALSEMARGFDRFVEANGVERAVGVGVAKAAKGNGVSEGARGSKAVGGPDGVKRADGVGGVDGTAEFGLPTALGDLAASMRIDARVTDSMWLGVTYAEDVADVREALGRREGS
jgi:hypothetical protein